MDWGRVPADTMVVESKNITLREVVQAAADGVDTPEGLIEILGLEELPAIERLRSGSCGGG